MSNHCVLMFHGQGNVQRLRRVALSLTPLLCFTELPLQIVKIPTVVATEGGVRRLEAVIADPTGESCAIDVERASRLTGAHVALRHSLMIA